MDNRETIDIAATDAETQQKIFEKIQELEKAGKFNEPVQPIDFSAMSHVDENYKYVPTDFFFLILKSVVRFIFFCFCPIVTKILMGGSVRGRENLRGLKNKGAIVTCNHVHTIDNLLVRQAVFPHSFYATVAEFNNRNDFLGLVLLTAGALPFSTSFKAMANFNKAVTKLLSKGAFITGYPEQALWMRYEKPRTYNVGMFHIAASNNAAVVPMFITWGEPGAFRKIFSKKKVATINILPPVFPDENKNRKENIKYLQKAAFAEVVECYAKVYGHAPEYSCPPELSPLNQLN